MSAVPKAQGGASLDAELHHAPAEVSRDGQHPTVSPARLQRASVTLRAIRQRYETGRKACPAARSYSVQVVVDEGDLPWISAAIESVERAMAERASRPGDAVSECQPFG